MDFESDRWTLIDFFEFGCGILALVVFVIVLFPIWLTDLLFKYDDPRGPYGI